MPTANSQSHEQITAAPDENLSAPLFDDKAVATAHPVEPLPPRRKLAIWPRPGLIIAVAVAVFVSLLALAAFWAVGANEVIEKSTADVEAAPSPETQTSPELKAAGEDSQVTHVQPKPGSRQRVAETPAVEKQGKPVARRVGVIRYSHSRSRVRF